MPISKYEGPLPDVAGNAARYLNQFANKYGVKPTLNPSVLANAADSTFHRTGTFVPTELALSQAQLETRFGTRGPNATNNPFNVGVWDNKTVSRPKTQEQGVQGYYNLMANDYLKKRSVAQLLKNFVNKDNNRYASNKDYEKILRQQIEVVKKKMQYEGGGRAGVPEDWKPNSNDKRRDGSLKGNGWLGVQKRPDGKISTELSVDVDMDGKNIEIPTMVPGLTKEELDYLLNDGKPTKAIVDKAVLHARQMIKQGLSPFR